MNRVVTINGAKSCVEEAKKWIENIIESVNKPVSNFLIKREFTYVILIIKFNFIKKKLFVCQHNNTENEKSDVSNTKIVNEKKEDTGSIRGSNKDNNKEAYEDYITQKLNVSPSLHGLIIGKFDFLILSSKCFLSKLL